MTQMKKQYLALFFTCFTVLLWADEQEKHEFTLGGAMGMSGLKPALNGLKSGNGGIMLGYSYFFNDEMGVSTGLEMSFGKWDSSVDQISDSYLTGDGEEPFEFRSSISGYTEVQTSTYLVLPVLFRFQYPLFNDDHLTYFSIGGKVGFPLRARYKTSGATFTTSAYYPEYNVLLESPESRGLGTFTEGEQVSDLHLKTRFMLSAEMGMKWDVSNQFSLYTGLCLDYGLNNINGKRGQSLLVYDPEKPANFRFNSTLHSQYTQDGRTRPFISRINPVFIGVVVCVAFKLPE
jgi:hypothetical protein